MSSGYRCSLLLLACLFVLKACALDASKQLSTDASRFAISVELLTAVLEDQYKRTEVANRIVLRDSIDLQLQLGGNPEVSVDLLFNHRQALARNTVLRALNEYARQLSHLLEGGTLQSLGSAGVNVITDLKDISVHQFDLSHSLNHFQTRKLISSLSGFAKILLRPKRNQELAKITAQMQEPLRQLSALLYLDIGSSDQDSLQCAHSLPGSLLTAGKAAQKICKGGLRGLMDNALKTDMKNWKQRASLLSASASQNRTDRRKLIEHIFDLQHFRQRADDLMVAAQQALVLMVNAHAELVFVLNKKKSSDSLVTAGSHDDPIFLFIGQMALIQQENEQLNLLLTQIRKE